ncbi:hypothetical protein LIP_1622 [Limnochorda pilosa]|uniref:Uncharacterized protein n=1 Tax=Limnochorda pilosa TaxID=1555112 RepID=A0A0K2SK23_LIMPI|nr:hypothetical protein LIP_1622 [Limnochorda pilosa]
MDAKELERGLLELASVGAVRVVPGTERPIDEIHVLATPGPSPKQVVRDVEALLLTRFGLRLDRRLISVVQLAGAYRKGPERVVLERLTVEQTRQNLLVRVGLLRGDEQATGEAEAASSPESRALLAAEATLRALEKLWHGRVRFGVEAQRRIQVAHRWCMAVRVGAVATGGDSFSGVGVALIRRSDEEAAARAVLNATQRRLQIIAPGPSGN